MSKMFIPYFIKNVIIKNPIKMLIIVALIVFYNIGTNTDPVKKEHTILHSHLIEADSVFITRADDGDLSLMTLEDGDERKGDKIITEETSDGLQIIIILSVLLSFVLVVGTFISDEEIGWEFVSIFTNTKDEVILNKITCEFEDDIFYYIYEGKLLSRAKRQLYSDDLIRTFKKSNLSILPEFLTKQQRRDSKLKDLFGD